MSLRLASVTIMLGVWVITVSAQEAKTPPEPEVDFNWIKPILEANCVKCHGADRYSGDFRLDTKEFVFAGGENGAAIFPGQPEKSTLYTTTILPENDKNVMPPEGRGPLSKEQSELLRLWIQQGAKWPENLTLKRVDKAIFGGLAHILKQSCFPCHGSRRAEGNLRLDTRDDAIKGGRSGRLFVPYDASKSLICKILETSPAHIDGKLRFLNNDELDYLRRWIDQGAIWPKDEDVGAKDLKSNNKKLREDKKSQ